MNQPHLIGLLSELKEGGGRMRVKVAGKDIFVVFYQEELFALDSFCYHAGGPLFQGDIEVDMNDSWGPLCIVCPWHKYRLTLRTGEGLYKSIDPHNLDEPPKLCSKGVKQRAHTVTVKDNQIYVTLSDGDSNATLIESDHYNKKT